MWMKLDRILKVSFFSILFLLVGCGESGQVLSGPDTPGEIPAAEFVTATPFDERDPVGENMAPRAESACAYPYYASDEILPEYQLNASIALSEHVVTVDERIVYPNTSTDELESLRLIVEPSRVRNVFSLSSVVVGGEVHEDLSLTNGVLELHLPSSLSPGCAVDLSLEFILNMPEQDGLFGYTDEQLMLTNWYPFIPPYQYDQKWIVHPPARYGEHLVYPLADFLVALEFEEEVSSEMIAAPAPAMVGEAGIVYELQQARTFSLAVLPEHRHISRSVEGVEFHVYFKPESAAAAQAALDTMVNAVDVFAGLYGEYPFDSLTTAEIEMYDGMEYDGIFFLGRDVFPAYDYTARNIFTLLVAHETAHNWWFSQVANDQAIEPWLDEAICTYNELLYLEKVHPELVDWWWDFRVFDHKPVGPIDVSIYDYFDYERYRQAVYLRGALFFQAVRDEVGDGLFFEFIQKYYLAGKGRVTNAELFFSTLEQVSDQEIDAIRSDFFKNP